MRRLPRPRTNASLAKLARELPLADLAPLVSGIFALFALLGLIIDILTGGHMTPAMVVVYSLLSGLVAVGYALGLMRRNWWLFLSAVAVQVLWFTVTPGAGIGRAGQSASVQLKADAIAVLVLMTVAYTAFLGFINVTAARYLRVRAEMDLAHEIHQVLVPAIDRSSGGFDFFGASFASGDVGGDLVDLVDASEFAETGAGWFGYVADVSGHGVSAGVVMGMFKSALRMRLHDGDTDIGTLLRDVNAVLFPLKSGAMYVTAACVRGRGDGTLDYAVAGHLPILRVRGGGVEQITTPQIPVGVFADRAFTSASMTCARGDLLALVTDGLTEVFDADDRELGLEAIESLLAASAERPLREIADAMLARARAHGRQLDDQSLLLIRRQ